MKFFFHKWLNFLFDSFLSTFNTCIQLQNVNEIFQSIIIKVFQKKKFYQVFDKATSKSWTRTLDPDPGPWTRTLKNLDPEEPGP